jgi:hypothetical protein
MELTLTSLLLIGVVIFVAFYVIKFIVSPFIKLVAGILVLVAAIYVLQHFFQFDLSFMTNFLNKYINFNEWVAKFGWITNLMNTMKPFFVK